MGDIKSIEKKIKEYEKSQHDINKRKKAWNDDVKNKIHGILEQIANTYKIGWSAQKNEFMPNFQSVHLVFHRIPSGIIKEGQSIVKEGGYLNYSQKINGKVHAAIVYPYVEDFVSKMESKSLDVYEPEEITHQLIYQHVENFLDAIIAWEKG